MEATISRLGAERPSDARQVRSRKALYDALLALLEEKPFDQLTIREISARADIGYATFFRHYPDKESLLSDVASEEIADLLNRASPLLLGFDGLEPSLALCRHVVQHRALWAALLTGGAAGIVRDEFIRQARVLATKATRDPPSWLPADFAVVHGAGGTIDLLAWWLAQDADFPAERIAGILDRLIIAPLGGKIAPPPTAAG
jgi:AcrR family transcriptional regulator